MLVNERISGGGQPCRGVKVGRCSDSGDQESWVIQIIHVDHEVFCSGQPLDLSFQLGLLEAEAVACQKFPPGEHGP